MSDGADRLRAEILDLVRSYHAAAFPVRPLEAGSFPIPCAGRVFDAEEVVALVDASLDFWLTAGRYADRFEREFARLMGVRHALLVNSGSSANLIAISALTSPKLGDGRLKPGDEVITPATGFPTTVNPIIQNGLIPVFIDIDLSTYNLDPAHLERALSPKTGAIMAAHTLGNPFDLDAVTAFAKRHDLWLVEDCCDAVGSTYGGKTVGTFGDLATVSFYPAHHVTMGEGGAVLTDSPLLKKLAESFRDWGRDCWCAPGADDTCGKRFDWQLGELPHGYDHKYTYAHIGYNFKITDMQAAVGVAQLGKLAAFGEARRRNFHRLREGLSDLADVFLLPEATPKSDPSWFGFPLAVQPGAPFTRADVLARLTERKVATRAIFAGNLVRQPAYADVVHRRVGDLANSDYAMTHAFWLGVYPGLKDEAIDYMAAVLRDFVAERGCRHVPAPHFSGAHRPSLTQE
jgi:CDP-6-deoxy-D-xylo-4-hexulose-3-dehydrase